MSTGKQPLPFGHSNEAAVDVEGLVVRIELTYCDGYSRLCSSSKTILSSYERRMEFSPTMRTMRMTRQHGKGGTLSQIRIQSPRMAG